MLSLSPVSLPEAGKSCGTSMSPPSGRGCINSGCSHSREGGGGEGKCWAPDVNSYFRFRVINVSLSELSPGLLRLWLSGLNQPSLRRSWGWGKGFCISCHPQMNEVVWEQHFLKLGLEAGEWVVKVKTFLLKSWWLGENWSLPSLLLQSNDCSSPETRLDCLVLVSSSLLSVCAIRWSCPCLLFCLPCLPLPPWPPKLDTFPLCSQTSPSPHPLTEQSFIKLFHALSGGGPWGLSLFRPFVEAPRDRPA